MRLTLPWFFATTPAPRVAVPVRRSAPRRPWRDRLAHAYVAWAERSHESLRGSAAGR